jgi:hypothetical protein
VNNLDSICSEVKYLPDSLGGNPARAKVSGSKSRNSLYLRCTSAWSAMKSSPRLHKPARLNLLTTDSAYHTNQKD